MVKVQYNGDISPINIKVPMGLIKDWEKGEVKDLKERCANILIKNTNFIITDAKVSKKQEKVEEKEDINFDLDGDGDFDKDDVSIGAKAMAAGRKLNKE